MTIDFEKLVSDLFHVHSTLVESECIKRTNEAIGIAPKRNSSLETFPYAIQKPRGGGLPYEEYMGVCHELGSHFQGKIPSRVCQFLTKIPERAIIFVRNSR